MAFRIDKACVCFWVRSFHLCCNRITEVQCDRLSNRRTWFHLHSCLISSDRLAFYSVQFFFFFLLLNCFFPVSSLSTRVMHVTQMNCEQLVNWFDYFRAATDSAGERDNYRNVGRNSPVVELSAPRKHRHCVLYGRLLLRRAMASVE